VVKGIICRNPVHFMPFVNRASGSGPQTGYECSDPDDDIFLECGQAAQANYLVTGNIKHFPASWAGTSIVTARWLLDSLPAGKSKGGQ